MADIFLSQDARKLLQNKSIMYLGDSNVRAMYKDMVWLLRRNTLVAQAGLKRKGELSFENDVKLKGTALHRGRTYSESRRYYDTTNATTLEFHFITRCYCDIVRDILENIHRGTRKAPDVLVINSCVWDVTRWGPKGVMEFKDNLLKLAKDLQWALPKETLMIWTTSLPVSQDIKGGFLIRQVEFLNLSVHFDIVEANFFARDVMVNHGFDILDLHYHLRLHIHKQSKDGLHWMPHAVRHLTNLLLTHFALSWGQSLPGRFRTVALDSLVAFSQSDDPYIDKEVTLPQNVPNEPNNNKAEASKPPRNHRKEQARPYPKPKRRGGQQGRPQPYHPHPPVPAWPQPDRFNKYGEPIHPPAIANLSAQPMFYENPVPAYHCQNVPQYGPQYQPHNNMMQWPVQFPVGPTQQEFIPDQWSHPIEIHSPYQQRQGPRKAQNRRRRR